MSYDSSGFEPLRPPTGGDAYDEAVSVYELGAVLEDRDERDELERLTTVLEGLATAWCAFADATDAVAEDDSITLRRKTAFERALVAVEGTEDGLTEFRPRRRYTAFVAPHVRKRIDAGRPDNMVRDVGAMRTFAKNVRAEVDMLDLAAAFYDSSRRALSASGAGDGGALPSFAMRGLVAVVAAQGLSVAEVARRLAERRLDPPSARAARDEGALDDAGRRRALARRWERNLTTQLSRYRNDLGGQRTRHEEWAKKLADGYRAVVEKRPPNRKK